MVLDRLNWDGVKTVMRALDDVKLDLEYDLRRRDDAVQDVMPPAYSGCEADHGSEFSAMSQGQEKGAARIDLARKFPKRQRSYWSLPGRALQSIGIVKTS